MDTSPGDQTPTWSHPVERVTWTATNTWLRRHELTLPTHAQRQHACRAGTDTPWHGVSREGELRANVADRYLRENGGPPGWAYTLEIDDGFVVHAPVGSFPANELGFHDMHGNVAEWCAAPSGSGDPDEAASVGGSWAGVAPAARSAHFEMLQVDVWLAHLGFRAARPLR